jgi:hypothetical protein
MYQKTMLLCSQEKDIVRGKNFVYYLTKTKVEFEVLFTIFIAYALLQYNNYYFSHSGIIHSLHDTRIISSIYFQKTGCNLENCLNTKMNLCVL